MSAPRSNVAASGRRWWRPVSATMAWGLAVHLSFAAARETPPVESPGPAKVPEQATRPGQDAADALGAAKRDFEAVRQSRTQGAASGERMLPRFAVPDLNPGAGSAGKPDAGANRPAPPARLGHGPNWLVEGASRSRDEERRQGERGGRERRDEGATGSRRIDGNRSASAPARGRTRDDERTELTPQDLAASNPLTPFLAGWMSSSDYALLRARGKANAAVREAGSGASGTAAATDWLVTHAASDLPVAGAHHGPGTAQATGQGSLPANPFLAALESAGAAPGAADKTTFATRGGTRDAHRFEPASPAGVVPAAPPALPAGHGSILESPAATPARPNPAATPVPDFAKPKSDEKLFKPLKRF